MGPVLRAAFVGTVVEFYDFFVFAMATTLVFGTVFFPTVGGERGTLVLAVTFAVAVVLRPLGAVLFGHVGDRLGRKRALVYTMALMGAATFAIGLLPTYATIGPLAPALLIALRCLQGLAVGGEWSGAALLIAEHAPPRRRSTCGLVLQLAPFVGFALAAATFLAVFAATGDPRTSEAFQSWGWRIPFLLSVCLLAVGLYVRRRVEETPLFAAAVDRAAQARVPVRTAWREQRREILRCSGALAAPFGFLYIAAVFVAGYAGTSPSSVPPGVLGFSDAAVLASTLVAGAGFVLACPLAAVAADRYGRRSVIAVGNALAVPAGLAAFPVMKLGGFVALIVGPGLLFVVIGLTLGPAAAFVPELFALRYRCTATGLAYNGAGIAGGALLVVAAPRILDRAGSFAVGGVLAALAVVSLVCLRSLPETRGADLSRTPEARRARPRSPAPS
ncbi:MAG: MFS transporter [Sporichthyaceae bacterium]